MKRKELEVVNVDGDEKEEPLEGVAVEEDGKEEPPQAIPVAGDETEEPPELVAVEKEEPSEGVPVEADETEEPLELVAVEKEEPSEGVPVEGDENEEEFDAFRTEVGKIPLPERLWNEEEDETGETVDQVNRDDPEQENDEVLDDFVDGMGGEIVSTIKTDAERYHRSNQKLSIDQIPHNAHFFL
jgi:hypothetical protein